MSIRTIRTIAFLIAITAIACGCRREKISTYRVPRETIEAASSLPGKPFGDELTWDVPDGWTEVEAAGSLRQRTYRLAESGNGALDVTVYAIRGPAGGLLGNTNRLRSQLQLTKVDGVTVKPLITEIQTGAGVGHLADVAGEEIKHSTAGRDKALVVLLKHGGRTWFVEMVGPAVLFGPTTRAEFAAMVKTLRPAGGSK